MLQVNNSIHLKKMPTDTGIKIAAVSLGCSKNRVDTEEILGLLSNLGYILTDDCRLADIILINTCSFIEQAQQESINTILEIAAQKRSINSKIVVAGCLTEVIGRIILNKIPEIDGAIGVHSYSHLNKFLKILINGNRAVLIKQPLEKYSSLSPRILTASAHSANVKIAEGCSNCCHYCLIPKIRGPYRSRSSEDIIAEIELLLQKGTREINLIAQDTTAYGSDIIDSPNLKDLIEKIVQLKHKFWLRIMYTYPSRIDDKLIEMIAAEPRICNYLDIPLQHINDQILKNMNRKYNKKTLSELIQKMRKNIPGLVLRTTFMVGYPGESKAQFDELLEYINEYPFERLGAFAYSAQKETIAGSILKQVPQRVIKSRHRIMMIKQQQIAHRLNLEIIGKRLIILVDKKLVTKNKWYFGRSEFHAPEVDGGVYFRSNIILNPGDWVSVRVCAASPYNLLACKPLLLEELPE